MNARASQSAGVAGLCFLGCGLIVALAYVSALWRTYAPLLREFLLWLGTPQFGIGMVLGLAVACLSALAFIWSEL